MQQLIVYLLLLFTTAPAFANPAIFKTKKFYTISGNNEEELRQQMNALGPKINEAHFDAQTIWHIGWHYTWQIDNPSQNPCYIIHNSVTATITLLLPRWINQTSAPADLKNKWAHYLIALENHEKQHEINGINAAKAIEYALLKIPAMPNCKALKEKIDETAKAILNQHHLWDQQYDSETLHGKNQGATFP
ncbi:DUF922 domain-containing Zn-dependent protease [Legionella clemsonensis]|uniref:DUF922 domain-containing protein n=1 Tax=Legionella clemsonensis TaxID=1867846 RepID=A0A222P4K7_9GAMM|nr:DUF922 domain-containing protein [Legionella clemsonensis]ASQ46790.1 hypothetical protein clem_11220 [Legionella clemsonensis]